MFWWCKVRCSSIVIKLLANVSPLLLWSLCACFVLLQCVHMCLKSILLEIRMWYTCLWAQNYACFLVSSSHLHFYSLTVCWWSSNPSSWVSARYDASKLEITILVWEKMSYNQEFLWSHVLLKGLYYLPFFFLHTLWMYGFLYFVSGLVDNLLKYLVTL